MSTDSDDEPENGEDTLEQDLTAFDGPSPVLDDQATTTPINSAEAFDADALNDFLLERRGRVIAVIGDFRSGKTTLATALYGFLKEGSFGSLEFAESRTLIGLERRLHDLTFDSMRATPEVERTSIQSGLQFLHLELVDEKTNRRSDLFFSDRAGEFYKQLRSGEVSAKSLEEIEKADFLLILIDGKRLCDPRQIANVFENVRQTMRVLIEEEAIKAETTVQIVTTKMDEISSSKKAESIEDQLTRFENEVKDQIGHAVPSLVFARITTRALTIDASEITAFSDIVSHWINSDRVPVASARPNLAVFSDFERLTYRTP